MGGFNKGGIPVSRRPFNGCYGTNLVEKCLFASYGFFAYRATECAAALLRKQSDVRRELLRKRSSNLNAHKRYSLVRFMKNRPAPRRRGPYLRIRCDRRRDFYASTGPLPATPISLGSFVAVEHFVEAIALFQKVRVLRMRRVPQGTVRRFHLFNFFVQLRWRH